MSKFVRFTIKGEPRLINVDMIHVVDYYNGEARIFMSDLEDPDPWPVDQSFEEVCHAIASACDGFYNRVVARYSDEGVCQHCGAYIPTDHRMDYIDKKDVRYCYWCGATIDKTGL